MPVPRSPLTTVLVQGLELVNLDGKGLGYVARQLIKAGTVIIREDGLKIEFVRHDVHSQFHAIMMLAHALLDFLPHFPVLNSLRAPASKYKETAGWFEKLSLAPGFPDWDTLINLVSLCRSYTFEKGKNYDDDPNRTLVFHPQAVFLNHSCDPNAMESARINKEGVIALRDIHPGEEVTICYRMNMLYLPTDERLAILRSTEAYGFDCVCSRCQVPLLIDDELVSTKHGQLAPLQIDALRQEFEECLKVYESWLLDDAYFSECVSKLEMFVKNWTTLAICHWRLMMIRTKLCNVLLRDLDRIVPPDDATLMQILSQQVEAERHVLKRWPMARMAALGKLIMMSSSPDNSQPAFIRQAQLDLDDLQAMFNENTSSSSETESDQTASRSRSRSRSCSIPRTLSKEAA